MRRRSLQPRERCSAKEAAKIGGRGKHVGAGQGREQQARVEDERKRLAQEQAAREKAAVDKPANIQMATITPLAESAPPHPRPLPRYPAAPLSRKSKRSSSASAATPDGSMKSGPLPKPSRRWRSSSSSRPPRIRASLPSTSSMPFAEGMNGSVRWNAPRAKLNRKDNASPRLRPTGSTLGRDGSWTPKERTGARPAEVDKTGYAKLHLKRRNPCREVRLSAIRTR